MRGIIILATCIGLMTGLVVWIHQIETSNMEAHVGESVVLDHDTLTIVSFSTFTDEYMLSNGASISSEYLNNIK